MADTMGYFIAGYAVIFGLLAVYALYLVLLGKKVKKDREELSGNRT